MNAVLPCLGVAKDINTYLEIGPDAFLCCGGLYGRGIVKGCRVLENVLEEVLIMGFEGQAGLLWPIDITLCFRPQLVREPACGKNVSSLCA